MINHILNILKHKYPQNFILKHPLRGSIIFLLLSFIFTVLYRPLKTHESLNFNYSETMAVYILAMAVIIYLLIHLVKSFPVFSSDSEWTFGKEAIAILMILSASGFATYAMGFVMEEPENRLNIRTFLDSCRYSFFIGIFPFGFFTLINIRHLFNEEVSQEFSSLKAEITATEEEDKILIISRLKKEELSFFPHQFIYAESDGNYVKFNLDDKERTRTEIIRNSMNEIEQQLSGVSCFLRVHRAFIINVKKIRSKKGNTLGYRLKLYGTENEIPVSRQKLRAFDMLLKQYN